MEVINHSKPTTVGKFVSSEELKWMGDKLRKRFEGKFPETYLISWESGNYIYPYKGNPQVIPAVEVKFHHKILNKSLNERWSLYYVKEVVDKNSVLDVLVKRITNSMVNNEVKDD